MSYQFTGQAGELWLVRDRQGIKIAEIDSLGVFKIAAEDNFEIGGAPVGNRVIVTHQLLAASVDQDMWVADRAYLVTSIRESHAVIGGSSAAVAPRKITDTSVPGATASATVLELLATPAIGLETTKDTSVAPALVAASASLTFAAGDRLALNFSGTLTGLVGSITVVLQPA